MDLRVLADRAAGSVRPIQRGRPRVWPMWPWCASKSRIVLLYSALVVVSFLWQTPASVSPHRQAVPTVASLNVWRNGDNGPCHFSRIDRLPCDSAELEGSIQCRKLRLCHVSSTRHIQSRPAFSLRLRGGASAAVYGEGAGLERVIGGGGCGPVEKTKRAGTNGASKGKAVEVRSCTALLVDW